MVALNDPLREHKLAKKREAQAKYRNTIKGKATQKKATKRHRASLEVDMDKFLQDAVVRANRRANDKGIECTITKDELRQVFIESNGVCALSNMPISTIHHDRYKASIDRIDSDKGYTMDNIQIVASCVNMAKSDMKLNEFWIMIDALAANKVNYGKRKTRKPNKSTSVVEAFTGLETFFLEE